MSTASGIPDYRSCGGLYAACVAPETALSIANLQAHHVHFQAFVEHNMYTPAAKPNELQAKMAAISNQCGAIVTQNVAGLARLPGACHVVEFHGNQPRIYCQQCHQHLAYQTY